MRALALAATTSPLPSFAYSASYLRSSPSSSASLFSLQFRRHPPTAAVQAYLPPMQSSSSMAAAAASSDVAAEQPKLDGKPFSVLFVCLGNICRSPAAEAVFRRIVKQRGLEDNFFIDSAGTIGYHEGGPADPRMRSAAQRRGINVTSISRPIKPSDFREFDIILAMDLQNQEDILSAFERWRFKETLPDDAPKKVKLMCSFCKNHKETEVPDPYYGGPKGFEKVLDLLEDACESLLASIMAENSCLSSS